MISSLAELLAPMSVNEFVRDYWGKKPVHIPGPRDKFDGIMVREDFFEYGKSPAIEWFVGKADEAKHFHQLGMSAYNARALYHLGMTVQIEDLHWANTPVRELLAAIKEGLGMFGAMEAAAFLSRAGTGYGIHYDPNPDIWALQIHGSKTWRYSAAPAAKHPIEHVTLTPKGKPLTHWVELERPDESAFLEAHLSPGDLFYFPAGTWHTPSAREESLHIVLASQVQPWTDFVFPMLKDELLWKWQWRQVPLDHPASPRPMHEELRARIDDLKGQLDALDLSPGGPVMQKLRVAAQLGETQRTGDGLSPWAHRARRLSWAEADKRIDRGTELEIRNRRQTDKS